MADDFLYFFRFEISPIKLPFIVVTFNQFNTMNIKSIACRINAYAVFQNIFISIFKLFVCRIYSIGLETVLPVICFIISYISDFYNFNIIYHFSHYYISYTASADFHPQSCRPGSTVRYGLRPCP